MKKVLTIITIMVILLSISIVSNAAVEITEEKLEESFNKMLQKSEDSSGYSFDKEKDIILLKNEDGTLCELMYDLEGKPKFYTDMKFEKSMTKEETDKELEKVTAPAIGFVLTTDIIGISNEDSTMYFFSKYMESSMKNMNNKTAEYTNGIEYAKTFYPDEINFAINDELFTLVVSKQQETETEYILRAELIVNIEKDFSTLTGSAEKNSEEIFGQLIGTMGSGQFTEKFEGLWDELGSVNENEENLEYTNNVVANIQKIPQTGNEISLQKILYSIILIATLLGVCLAIYNKKH